MDTVALPIENKVRELDGKLWLGLNLIDRGYKVATGPSWEIKHVLDKIDPDTYLTKDPGDGNIEFFKNLRNAGVNVCGLAPEVGVNSSVNSFMKNRQDILNYMDAYFAWGEVTADSIRTHYEDSIHRDKVVVTGNPRFDLVTSELRSIYGSTSQDIIDKYGEYVLINTNFTLANPVTREKTYSKIQDAHPDRDPHEESIGELQVYHSFLELIFFILENNIEKSVILRPHPGEDHSTYQHIFAPYDDIYVEHYGDVRSWIKGANAVIHHDCTTGIEAALMETPVLSYQAAEQELNPKPLSQIVSHEVTTQNEVLSWLNDHDSSRGNYSMSDRQKEQVRGYFPNIGELAAPKICEFIDSLESTSGEYDRYKNTIKSNIEQSIKASHFGTTIVNFYDFFRDQLMDEDYRQSRVRQRQKFSGLNKEEIVERIQLFSDFISAKKIVIEPISKTKHSYTISCC